jgi:peptidoglycan/LPS O-acetylase OafA/YrhL
MNSSTAVRRGVYLNKDGAASVYFDLFRALAAFAVLLHHIRPSFFVDYAQVGHKNPLIQMFYLISSKGYQSVMIFFVLSGFFISSSVIQSVSKSKWSIPHYLNNRISRLGTVLLPALLLTFVWNELSISWFHDHALTGDMAWPTFFTNLFFLQGIGPFPSHMFGENDALWSLSIEFWFYILFPCILLAFTSRKTVAKLAYGCAAVLLALFLGKNVLPLFGIWLLGTAVLLIPDFKAPKHWAARLLILAIPLIAFAGAFVASGRSKAFSDNFPVGLTFAALLYVIRVLYNRKSVRAESKLPRLIYKAAGFSYTLYLTHFPINNLLVSYINGNKLQPGAAAFLIFSSIVLLTVLYAWMVSLFTEGKTASVRTFLERRFTRLIASKKEGADSVKIAG